MRCEETLREALEQRFGERIEIPEGMDSETLDRLRTLGLRRSHRAFDDRPVSSELLRLLIACAFSAPSKSDLQQADIIDIRDPVLRGEIAALVPSMPWVGTAPAFLVVCGDNRRTRRIAEERGRAFANDHLDAFFNAAVDGGIHLAFLVVAIEAVGLGCCPVSVIRNHAARVSQLLALPAHVFPIAGLAVGWPAGEAEISLRLPLDVTFHHDRYCEDGTLEAMRAYDRRRREVQPPGRQRRVDLFGESDGYGWMEEKARQYALPERADFGAFIRSKGFRLD